MWCATTPDGRQVVPLRPIVGSATPTTLLTETGQAPRRSLAADQLLRIERTVLVTSFDEPSEEIASARDVMSPESVCTERRYTFRVGPSLSTQTDVTIDALDRASGGRFVAVPPSSGVVALAADGALLWLSVPSERLFVNGAPFRTVPTARNTARCGSALALHSGGRGLSGTRFPRVPGTIQGARDLR
ncbi:MAG: hypothetical protein RMH81_08620 [Thermomicrobium sp.]|nr:hypothetical protein [Thermomicrobium sp.]